MKLINRLKDKVKHEKSKGWNTAQNAISLRIYSIKCDQTCRKLQIWLYFLKKFLMGNFIFCALKYGLLGNSLKFHKRDIIFNIQNGDGRFNTFVSFVLLACLVSLLYRIFPKLLTKTLVKYVLELTSMLLCDQEKYWQ